MQYATKYMGSTERRQGPAGVGHGGVRLTRECDSCDTLHDKGQPRTREGRHKSLAVSWTSWTSSLLRACGSRHRTSLRRSTDGCTCTRPRPGSAEFRFKRRLSDSLSVCLSVCLVLSACCSAQPALPFSAFQPSFFPRPVSSNRSFFATYSSQFSTSLSS